MTQVCIRCGSTEKLELTRTRIICLVCQDKQKARRRALRQAKIAAYDSAGLVKVRGALGGTYYE